MLLVSQLSRFPRFFLFIAISLVLHSICLLFDVSGRTVSSSVRQVGVGLVERPLTQFIRMAQDSEGSESLLRSPQAVIAPQEKKTVSVRKTQTVVTEPQAPQIQQDNVTTQQENELPQPKASIANKIEPVMQIEGPVDSPSEVQLNEAAITQGQDAIVDAKKRPQGLETGEGSRNAESAVASSRVTGTSNAVPSGDMGFQDALPHYDQNPRPVYPKIARRRGLQGIVLLEVLVFADGQVEKTFLLESSGYRSLDRAALRAVRRWQFKPATSLGLPVASRVVVPIDFVLNKN